MKSIKILILFSSRSINIGDLAILKGYVNFLKSIFPSPDIHIAHSFLVQPCMSGVKFKKHPFIVNSRAPRFILITSTFFCFLFYISRGILSKIPSLSTRFSPEHYDLIINAHALIFRNDKKLDGVYQSIINLSLLLTFRQPLIVGPTSAMGPFTSKVYNWFIKKIYNNATVVFVRDYISEEYLLELGLNREKLFLVHDMSFWVKACAPERAKEILSAKKVPLTTGLIAVIPNYSISNKLDDSLGNKKYDIYTQNIASYINWLIEEMKCAVLLMPFQFNDGRQDERTCSDILLLTRNRDSIFFINEGYAPEEIKGLFSLCDIVVSSRLHGGLFAFSVGTPAIFIGADRQRALGIVGKIGRVREFIIFIEKIRGSQELFNVLKSKTILLYTDRKSEIGGGFSKDTLLIDSLLFKKTLNSHLPAPADTV